MQEVKDKCERLEPKIGYTETYWGIYSGGRVFSEFWGDTPLEHNMYAIGNIFKTKEEAEFEAERLKVLRELGKMGRAFKPHQINHTLCYYYDDSEGDSPMWGRNSNTVAGCYGNYYFDSKEELKEAVEKIGEDRIKKYLFNVED